jgi:hypothetical protein
MRYLNGEALKRWLVLLILSLLVQNVSAEDNDNGGAILVYYGENSIDCYNAEEVEDISHIASSNILSEPDILRIVANGEQHDYLLSDVNKVEFAPPSEFFTIQTRTVTTRSYLTATLRSTLGGKWKKWDDLELGFIISSKLYPSKDEQPIEINCGKSTGPGTKEIVVSYLTDGLIGNHTYYYKAYAKYGKLTIYGNSVPFHLEPVTIWTSTIPLVKEDEENQGRYNVKVEADIFGDTDEIFLDPNGKIGFFYGTEKDLDRESKTAIRIEGSLNEVKDMEAVLKKLEPGKKYYYRPFVEVAGTIYYGITSSFFTGPSVEVHTSEAEEVGAASATVYYDLDVQMYEGQLKGGNVGIQFALTPDLDQAGEDTYHSLDNWTPSSNGHYSGNFTKLIPNTTYYYRAYAVIDGKRYYGNIMSFTTNDITVITYDAINITSTTAHVDGKLKDTDAINEGDQFGFYLNDTGNPGPDNSVSVSGTFLSNSTGEFWWNISGMKPSTTYYYRAYITYKGKKYYGEEKSFTTGKAEGIFGELGLFELRGPVKSCKWTNINGTNTKTFNESGMWMTEDGRTISSAFYYGITRDNLGRIVSGQYDEGGEQSWVYDSQGRRTEFTDIFWDGGETHTYTYDDNDLVLVEYVEMIGMDVEWNENYTLTYSNYVLDDHDNWISRTRRVSNDGSTSTETRVITYYE